MMRKFSRLALAACALLTMSMAALAADPGAPYGVSSEASDQKADSILVFNVYTSGATSSNAQNTRISITNTASSLNAPVGGIQLDGNWVHLFFVADSCQIADSYLCLTPNQTATFLASDVDPGVTGYIVAVLVDTDGRPRGDRVSLIGEEYVKFSSGHAANLAAVAYAPTNYSKDPACTAMMIGTTCSTNNIWVTPNGNDVTATLAFDGNSDSTANTYSYNQMSRVLAIDNIGARADGNDALLILNRLGGNLTTGANTLSTVFGMLFDDSENVFSFSIAGGCQLRGSLSNTFPRTTPRFETVIPAGRAGWAKVWAGSEKDGDGKPLGGLSGAIINYNPNAGANSGAFNGGHNLHTLTLIPNGIAPTMTASYYSAVLTIPVFPPSC